MENSKKKKISRKIKRGWRFFGIKASRLFKAVIPICILIFIVLRAIVAIVGWHESFIMIGMITYAAFIYSMMDNQFNEPNYIRYINRAISFIRGDVYGEREVPKNGFKRTIRGRINKNK